VPIPRQEVFEMSVTEPRAVFEAFLDAMNHANTAALEGLVHPDFVDAYPQSGERTHGLANLRAIVDNYPGGYISGGTDRIVGSEDRWVVTPSFTVQRIEGSGDTFTGVQKGRYPDGSEWHIVTIGEIRDGRVWRVQSFFAPAFEPPAWRAAWVEIDPAARADPAPRADRPG
jgi:hypothetical protein